MAGSAGKASSPVPAAERKASLERKSSLRRRTSGGGSRRGSPDSQLAPAGSGSNGGAAKVRAGGQQRSCWAPLAKTWAGLGRRLQSTRTIPWVLLLPLAYPEFDSCPPRTALSRRLCAQAPPPGKYRSFWVRTASTLVLIGSFVAIIRAGHVPLMFMILGIQVRGEERGRGRRRR